MREKLSLYFEVLRGQREEADGEYGGNGILTAI